MGHTHAQGTEPQVIQASHRTHLQVGSTLEPVDIHRSRIGILRQLHLNLQRLVFYEFLYLEF